MKKVDKLIILIGLFLVGMSYLVCDAAEDYNSCLAADKYNNPSTYDKVLFDKIINGEKRITYECFGAKGDGTKNDYNAIKSAHEFANNVYLDSQVMNGNGKHVLLTVYGTKGSTYYIGKTGVNKPPVYVYTHVDWQNANFLIEDYKDITRNEEITNSELYRSIFVITSPFQSTGSSYLEFSGASNNVVKKFKNFGTSTTSIKSAIDAITSTLSAEQKRYFNTVDRWNIKVSCSKQQVYRRTGSSGDCDENGENCKGKPMRENLDVNKSDGKILSPITWNYNGCIDSVQVWPIPDTVVTVKNGIFTTNTNNIVKQKKSDGKVFEREMIKRNIAVEYTGNVNFYNIIHYLNEDINAPYTIEEQNRKTANTYYGFIHLDNASNVILKNVKLSAHTFEPTKNGADTGKGTYDLTLYNSINVLLNAVDYACKDTEDAATCEDRNMQRKTERWGTVATEENKNIRVVDTKINRMDAHRGVQNLQITNSTIGVRGLRLIGSGYFYGDNLTFDKSSNIIELRGDYGSTWDGDILLQNSNYNYPQNKTTSTFIYSGNSGKNYYGYNAVFPNLYFNNINVNISNQSNANEFNIISLADFAGNQNDSNKKYYFRKQTMDSSITSNAIFANVKIVPDGKGKVYLFKDGFANKTNNLKIESYGDNNKYKISYDSSSKISNIKTNNNNLTNTNVNTKFTILGNRKLNELQNAVNNYIANKMEKYFKNYSTYVLTFDSNGGEACSPTSIIKFKNTKWGELCIPKKEGYYFGGWNTSKDGTGKTITSETKVDSNTRVYAIWKDGSRAMDVDDIVLDDSEEELVKEKTNSFSIIYVIIPVVIVGIIIGLILFIKKKKDKKVVNNNEENKA